MKNNALLFTFSTLMILANAAKADFNSDLALIRQLIPSGFDLAQAQSELANGGSLDPQSLSQNYVMRDFDKDGISDLLVLIEENPKLVQQDPKSGATSPCTDPTTQSCVSENGPRALQVFLGQKDGSFKLLLSNDKMVLSADDGGIFGDPLAGLTVNKAGSVLIKYYGGSADRWSHTDTIEFRGDDFYVVGQTDGGYNDENPDNTQSSTDINGVRPSGRTLSG